jgi:hypothetical protein
MKAIETEYKGFLFRSRLEARWAVFFDSVGMEWKYEAEGFEVDGHRYLPDFWLPEANAWAEVKGDPNGLRKEFTRMSAVLGAKSPLPGFTEGLTSLIVLGDIPDEDDAAVLHPVLSRRDAGLLTRTWGWFVPLKDGRALFSPDSQESLLYLLFQRHTTGSLSEPQSSGWNVESWAVKGAAIRMPRILNAYRAARQARFEHGATGR